MTKKHCEWCGAEFNPRQHNSRFCSTPCANAWHLDERRRAIELLRSQTYYGRELLAAAENEDSPVIGVGARALRGPLPAPAWSRDPVGTEPPIEGNHLALGVALGGAVGGDQ